MAQIQVTDLTFHYEGSMDNIFEQVSFSIDSNWKLGFLGRNGKGKTTFLRLLMGKEEYRGSILSGIPFDYFPYELSEEDTFLPVTELIAQLKCTVEPWQVNRELKKLGATEDILYRPFATLSQGEQTKVMLAVLFSGEEDFALIDEPTNHLDRESREQVKAYLAGKKGFILVSHDRDLLDACVDHVLVLNRSTIEVQAGNFSSWWENKTRKDAFARMENEKHRKEIRKLEAAADRSDRWAEKNENTKIGYDPIREHDRCKKTRSYIAGKTKKMQARVKAYESRMEREIKEQEGLLQDIEETAELKIMTLEHPKKILIRVRGYSLHYEGGPNPLFAPLTFELAQGECLFLAGGNGCGKSSVIKEILEHAGMPGFSGVRPEEQGCLETASGLVISYVNQDTSFLQGSPEDFCRKRGLSYSLFLSLLRQLDFERGQFEKSMEQYSEGQKKKVLLAASLLTPAHLYIWDEPLNYVDVFSRMQLEKLINKAKPTMLMVEHDTRFRDNTATRTIWLKESDHSADRDLV